MDITGQYQIAADRQAVWEALNNPEMLRTCIQGCETLERVGDDRFEGKVAAAIGPVRAKFTILLHLEDVAAPLSYTLVGESKAGSVGFGRGSADVSLIEQDGGTLLRYSAQFKVGGKLAQVGSRLVLGATKKTADDFFGCLSRKLVADEPEAGIAVPSQAERTGPGDSGPMAAAAAMPKGPLVAGVVAAGLLAWWFLVR